MLVIPATCWILSLSKFAGRCLCLWLFLRQHAVILLQTFNMKIGVGLQKMLQLLIILLISLVFNMNYHITEVSLFGEQVLDETDLELIAL